MFGPLLSLALFSSLHGPYSKAELLGAVVWLDIGKDGQRARDLKTKNLGLSSSCSSWKYLQDLGASKLLLHI